MMAVIHGLALLLAVAAAAAVLLCCEANRRQTLGPKR